MAVISNIFIDAGADFTTTVTVTDSTGSALNLTGYTHAAQIRKSYDSTSATVAFTTTTTNAGKHAYKEGQMVNPDWQKNPVFKNIKHEKRRPQNS